MSERLARIRLRNSTAIPTDRLLAVCHEITSGWAIGSIDVFFRYSRGAEFSGTCYYTSGKIHVNLGRQLVYPYRMGTNLGRAKTVGRRWYRPMYTIELRDGFEVVLFVFLHELYHLLVKRARRNTRQKEGMCDRFAARYLMDRYGATVRDPKGRPVLREEWDFQDLDGFVAAARDRRVRRRNAIEPRPASAGITAEQLLMFPA